MRRQHGLAALVAGIFGTCATAFGGPGWGVFNPLPGGNGSATSDSLGNTISADGQVAVGTVYLGGEYMAAAWRPDGVTLLPGPLGQSHGAHAVSADGSIIGGSLERTGPSWAATFWNSSGGGSYVRQTMADVPGGGDSSRILGLTADGAVGVGWGQSSSGGIAARWTNAQGAGSPGTAIANPPGLTGVASATAVSDDGSVIVGTIGATSFRHSGGTVQVNGSFGSSCGVLGVSGDGTKMVGYSVLGRTFATLWTDAGPSLLTGLAGAPDNASTRAIDISGDGSVIVGQMSVGSEIDAVVWLGGQPRLLADLLTESGADLTGWRVSHVSGVSADGTVIVGHARNPDGQLQGYVAVIPSPGMTGLLVAAAALASRRRR